MFKNKFLTTKSINKFIIEMKIIKVMEGWGGGLMLFASVESNLFRKVIK